MTKYIENLNLRDVYMKLIREIQTCLSYSKRGCVAYNFKTDKWSNIHINRYIHGNGLVITASTLSEKSCRIESEENFIMNPEFSVLKELLISNKYENGDDIILFSLSPPKIETLKIMDVFGVNKFCYLYIDERENAIVTKTKWHELVEGLAKALEIKILPINIKERRQ